MSLVDRTNEEIELSIELPVGAVLVLDTDSDSSFDPPHWVWLEVRPSDDEREARAWRLTYAEVELLYQRLGLILGKP